MTLDRLWQLDATNAASNSNFAGANIAENCSPSGINNALRALGVMAARELAFQAAAISASVSTNIVTATTGLYVPIVGAGAINSFGVVPGEQPSAAVFRFLEFSSSASISHGGSIFLPGGQSIKTQPGDVLGVLHEGSSDQWRGLFYSRAGSAGLLQDSLSVTTITNRSLSTSAISTVTLNAASASISSILLASINSNSISASVGEFTLITASGRPAVVFHGRATNVTYATMGTIMPNDNTIPQNDEGDEVLSLTVTPTNAASLLRITAKLNIGGASAAQAGCALFIDSTAGALAATSGHVGVSTLMDQMELRHYVSASNTTQRVYHVRVGSGAAGDVFLNGDATSRTYGGVAASYLEVEEILPG
jgi:hypothetical protein